MSIEDKCRNKNLEVAMDRKKLQRNIIYLIDEYIPDRSDLKKLIKEDIDCVKHILAEIDKYKRKEYINEDLELIQDIVFYYV